MAAAIFGPEPMSANSSSGVWATTVSKWDSFMRSSMVTMSSSGFSGLWPIEM